MCTSVRQGLHLLTLHDPQLSGSPFFFFSCYRHHRYLHSFPTRRSSDLLLPHLFTLAKHCVLFEDVPQVSLRDVTVQRSAGGLFSVALFVAQPDCAALNPALHAYACNSTFGQTLPGMPPEVIIRVAQ